MQTKPLIAFTAPMCLLASTALFIGAMADTARAQQAPESHTENGAENDAPDMLSSFGEAMAVTDYILRIQALDDNGPRSMP